MLTLLSGLFASLSYASSDMFSQRVTRATRPLTQMLWVLATGVVVILPVALLVDGLPDAGQWQGAYVAVVVIILGAPITPLLSFALALCAGGAVLTSFEGGARSTRGAPWALVAGVLFAGVMLCYAYSDIDWLSQAAISRTVSLVVTLPFALLSGSVAVPRALRVRAVGAGLLELSGVLLLTIAFALGPPTIAGVTTTQFGTFAVILGFVLLHERPKPNQWVGIVCTIAGVSLIAAVV